MEEDLIKVTPNKEKARSMLKMTETTLEMIKNIDKTKFPSNITKEYYDVVRELISIILLLDGYKTIGDSAHKRMIEYLQKNYTQFRENEISLINDLRIVRNKIAYDGFFIKEEYITKKISSIKYVIEKLKKLIEEKLN